MVSEVAKEQDGKTKTIESLINRIVAEFNKKHASFEDEFTGNFEMIKNIKLDLKLGESKKPTEIPYCLRESPSKYSNDG